MDRQDREKCSQAYESGEMECGNYRNNILKNRLSKGCSNGKEGSILCFADGGVSGNYE